MRPLLLSLISLLCFSFSNATEKVSKGPRPGFYISVEDFTDRTYHSFIVESKDSVQDIFNNYFKSELMLGEVDNPISIYNRKHSFYVERVTVFEKPNGKLSFRHLKYPNVFVKRSKLNPAVF